MQDITELIFNAFFKEGVNYRSLFEIHPQKAFYDIQRGHGVFTFRRDSDWDQFGVKKYPYPFGNENIIEVTELLISISAEKETIIKEKICAFLKKKIGPMNEKKVDPKNG